MSARFADADATIGGVATTDRHGFAAQPTGKG
jgi:hypothetical protein